MHVITANRLDNGLVVYQTAVGGWTPEIAEAQIYQREEQVPVALEAARADVAARLILNPYTVPVSETDGRTSPLLLRERIRAQGPTIAYAVPAKATVEQGGARHAA